MTSSEHVLYISFPCLYHVRCVEPATDKYSVVNMLEAIRANVNITLITIVVHIVIHAYTYLLR